MWGPGVYATSRPIGIVTKLTNSRSSALSKMYGTKWKQKSVEIPKWVGRTYEDSKTLNAQLHWAQLCWEWLTRSVAIYHSKSLMQTNRTFIKTGSVICPARRTEHPYLATASGDALISSFDMAFGMLLTCLKASWIWVCALDFKGRLWSHLVSPWFPCSWGIWRGLVDHRPDYPGWVLELWPRAKCGRKTPNAVDEFLRSLDGSWVLRGSAWPGKSLGGGPAWLAAFLLQVYAWPEHVSKSS